MLRNIKVLALFLLSIVSVQAQDIRPPNCNIVGGTITCGNTSLTPSSGSTSPGGSNTQLQYNNAGAFGGISGWTTNGSTTLIGGTGTTLTISGATLGSNAVAGGGMFASIGASGSSPGFYSYLTTDSVARVRIGMDSTNTASLAFGAGGASARDTFLYRSTAAVFNMGSTVTLSDATLNLGALNSAGRITTVGLTNSGNGAASTASSLMSGTLFTGGTGTTTFPQLFIQANGAAAQTNWNTSGTYIGVNAVAGFSGNFIDFQIAGSGRQFNITSAGAITAGNITGVNITAGAANSISWTGRGSLTSPNTTTITASVPIRISTGYTVATLPAAGTAGRFAYVTDQLTACAATGAALTGGGAVVCPVFDNGSAWVGG